MADSTPLYSKICFEFLSRINDPTTYGGGSPTYSYDIKPGNLITTKAGIEAQVNEAMFDLLGQIYMQECKGDLRDFCAWFPELVVESTQKTLSSAKWTIGSDNHELDYMYLVAAKANTNKLCSIQPNFNNYVTELGQPIMQGSSDFPVAIEIGKTITVYPLATFASSNMTFTYFKAPLVPTTGAFLTQNGGTDSPFLPHWNSIIAGIAEKKWRTKNGE